MRGLRQRNLYDHHEFFVDSDICEIVDELVWHFDEPFADSSAIPTFMVSKLAAIMSPWFCRAMVATNCLLVTPRYVIDKKRDLFSRVPAFVRKGLLHPLSEHLPHNARVEISFTM